jgi:hypothetical protein
MESAAFFLLAGSVIFNAGGFGKQPIDGFNDH